jgi:hypothetical protein
MDVGEEGWQADSRICMVWLQVTYRLIAGKGCSLDDFFILKRHLQSFADLWPTLMGFSVYI